MLAAVIGFGSSSRLASAYGVAVTATMLVDTLLTFFVIRYLWGYPLWLCLFATGFFFVVDVAFFGATLLKVVDGGWFPLLIGAIVFTLMTTWRQGRSIMFKRLRASSVPLKPFLDSLFVDPPQRVPGTAVFLTATPEATPHALLHNLNHNKVLHERVVFLTVEITDEPWVPFQDRVRLTKLGHGCWRMNVRYGFMNEPDIAQTLRDRRRARAGIRNDVDLVLPQPGDRRAGGRAAERHGVLARDACSRRWRATRATRPTTSSCRPTA